ncbi:MAG: hypothetical protein HGA82_03465 [Anaerolineales bacterium]|nr:hypothetical protein [Anaerolineales bacterium]
MPAAHPGHQIPDRVPTPGISPGIPLMTGLFKKTWILFSSFCQRLKDIRRAKKFDIVFIYREAFMLGTTFFEKRLRKRNPRIIFDFDDAIWLNDTSQGNENLS